MSVDNQIVREWRDIHQHRLVSPVVARSLFDYLDTLPWGMSRLRWDQVESVTVPFSDGDPQPAWVEKFTDTPIGGHGYITVAYAPGQEALVGATDEVLADVDLLYVGSPSARYFCGAEIVDDSLILAVEDFAEFSDEGVTVHLPRN
ncbi:hypothetical protein OHB14_30075 [Streptomyces sp. NBC_01613]|uniref:hypothetical protein n=1 Tax=Streptomyces sp. NBC_01613 TaxID=2975896 RepID=UPI00386E1454